jgi:hypothetical protein
MDVVLVRPSVVASTAMSSFNTSLFGTLPTTQLNSSTPFGTPVITSFGWQLDGNLPNHGRYLERFNFSVTPCAHVNNSCQYQVYAGLQSPAATTFPATVLTTLQTAVITTWSSSSSHIVNGTVCKSDASVLLDCARIDMPEQLVDSVPC